MSDTTAERAESPAARRRRRAGRISAWVLGGILLLSLAALAWIGIRAALAYQHLDEARAAATDAGTVLADPASAPQLIATVSTHTAAARDLTGDPVWALAEQLPWVGPQLSAVSTVAATLDDVATTALTPLSSVAASFSLDSIRPTDGAIDLAVFTELESAASAAATALGAADSDLAGIDRTPLLAPVSRAVDEVAGLVHDAYGSVDALSRTATLLPAMLGRDGSRDYLIVFQNNAEWRSLGGIVGAMVLVHTEGGRVTLADQASTGDFPTYAEPVVGLTDEQIRLFGTQPATFVQNVTQIPDFTRDGPIMQAMWQREKGLTVDGVLSIDPVALSYLLQATGPVTLGNGIQLTADNAVQTLLNQVYIDHEDPRVQDAIFASAAAAVFEAIAGGRLDPSAFVSALATAGAEHRLLLWNADAEEQAVLDGTTLQGATDADADVTQFGVYANDATSSKMDFYMRLESGAAWCGADAALTVTLRSTAPADAADLPGYLTGGGTHGVPPGEVETMVYVYLPADGVLTSTTSTPAADTTVFGGGEDTGRQVLTWRTRLAPGEEVTLDLRVRAPRTETIAVRSTPTVHALVTEGFAPTCGNPE